MQVARFVAELRRRRVFRVAAAYAVAAWAIMQVSDLMLPRLGLPDWTVTLVIVLTLLGFPIALVLGWAFDLTPAGVQRTNAPSAAASPPPPVVAVRYLVAGMLIALVGLGAYARVHSANSTSSGSPLRSLAVLPFVDMSPGHDQEYFSDGLTDELLNSLARLQGVRLAARTSAFQYKGKQVDLREVGRTLGVSGVIEGSVQRLGDRIRITVQLIDARAGFHVWSKKYDREARDLFAVQDEICEAVADALEVELGGGKARREQPTSDLRAHDLYLKGRFFWNQRTAQGLQQAFEYFRQALALDPEYALAWSGMAEAYVTPVSPLPPSRSLPLAKAAARKALELDAELVPAHTALATALLGEFDLAGAEREFRRALELDGSYPTAHQWYSELLALRGSTRAALAELRLAQQLDPLSMIIGWQAGYMLLFMGRNQEALTEFQNLAQLYPESGRVQYALADALLRLRRYDEAMGGLVALLELTPAQARGVRRALETGGPAALYQALWNPRGLPLPDSTNPAFVGYANERLRLSARTGRIEEAVALLQWLHRTRNLEPWQVLQVKLDPEFEGIRRDAEITRMLRELGVTPGSHTG